MTPVLSKSVSMITEMIPEEPGILVDKMKMEPNLKMGGFWKTMSM